MEVVYFAGKPEAQTHVILHSKALARTAIDILNKPGLLEKIQEDFTNDKKAVEHQKTVFTGSL